MLGGDSPAVLDFFVAVTTGDTGVPSEEEQLLLV